jgi:hypothetical protein
MNTPKRAAQAKELLQGGRPQPGAENVEIIGSKVRWDKNTGTGNPLENRFGNPFLSGKRLAITNDKALKAGVGKKN